MAQAKKQPDNKEIPVANEAAAPAAKPATPSPATTPMKPKRARRGLTSTVLFLALVAVSFWAYSLYQENRDLRDPEAQARRIVAQMNKLIILPETEVPGVFPIDKSQATEPFFKNAESGDLLVVYRSTQQAFIYSPSRKILVNAGVLVVNPEQEQVNAPKPAPQPAVAEEPAPDEEEL